MSLRGEAAEAKTAIRPVLRWAGSKRQLLPRLRRYWSADYERYVEPFCGSSVLFFLLQPTRAILSDANADLMQFYEVLRAKPVALWKDVEAITRTREKYLELRSIRPGALSQYQRAVRFLYLNRNCFNGLYRTDRSGRFNVPFSDSRTGVLPSLAEFINASVRLKAAQLRACDFGHTLRLTRNGDFVYMDPPYFVRNRRVFRSYGPREFLQKDVDRLGAHIDRLDNRGATFVLSFADCPAMRRVASSWTTRRARVRRQIAGFAGSRRFAYELIISNTDPR